jgi:hypothetical protein
MSRRNDETKIVRAFIDELCKHGTPTAASPETLAHCFTVALSSGRGRGKRSMVTGEPVGATP